MKSLFLFFAFCLYPTGEALALSVKSVKVSVTAESAAVAREKAIQQAHQAAFQKLLQESFPENTTPPPPYEKIEDMVSDFSIDQERTTPTSYAASLTFQFDDVAVHEWLKQPLVSPSGMSNLNSFRKGREPLKVEVKYDTHSEWRKIKGALEKSPAVYGVDVLALSSKGATIHLTRDGEVIQLQKDLQGENITLAPQGDGWLLKVGVSQ
jgi:hypothetical protein